MDVTVADPYNLWISLREECSFERNENIYELPSNNRAHSIWRRVESQGQLSCHHDAYNLYVLIQYRSLPFEQRELFLESEKKVVAHSLRIIESIPLRLSPLSFFLLSAVIRTRGEARMRYPIFERSRIIFE